MLEESYQYVHGGILRRIAVNNELHETFSPADISHGDPALAWWQNFLKGHEPLFASKSTRGAVRIVDLFCGCGGLALGICEGLSAAGFDPRIEAAVDVDADALKVYAHNLQPTLLVNASVPTLVDFQIFGQENSSEFAYDPIILNRQIEALKGQIDLICAGPPCQGHSNLNNHSRREDPRNLLYLSVPAVAIGLDVPVVVIENVPDVTNDRYGVVKTATALLQAAGYVITDHIIQASALGCAQARRRYFIVACKGMVPEALESVLRALKKEPVDVQWAIGDLLDVDGGNLFDSVSVLSLENQRRIDYLFEADLYELPNSIRPDCHKDGHTYGSVYGRLRWDKPAQTITTGFMSPGRGRFIHPLKRRSLTPHEAARLQSFPDTFKFIVPANPAPSRKSLSKWIGDAVPSVMGYATGICAATALVQRS